jgi:hypothetical protein
VGWLEEAWKIADRGEEEAEARVYYKGGGVVRSESQCTKAGM